MRRSSTWLAVAAGLLLPAFPAPGQSPPAPLPAPAPAPATAGVPLAILLDEIDALRAEVQTLRADLARANVDAAAAHREADELRQFIEDHHEFGEAFEKYSAIKVIAERDARRRRADEARAEREAGREARQQDASSRRAREQAEDEKTARYRAAGMASIGLDVYAGRMAYYYRGKDQVVFDIDYDPFFGIRYPRPYTRTDIDYSSMTLSGSVVNGADEVRNIGVAVVFFDESGSQVGGQTVQVNNARKDVPYPFTATVAMALNRPFASSSVYVLYADPAVGASPTSPAAP